MAHPSRYSEDDPFLARVREVCLSLPEAAEKISHGHPNFFTRKVFAVYGGMVKGDHASDAFSQALLVLPDPDERLALVEDPRFFVPAYYGPSGWVGLDFRAAAPDWDEVAELVDASYRNTAPARLVRLLDGV
jgi:hypothetical protein